MTDTTRQSVRDLYHHIAQAAGLVHVDGFGAYSIFEGDRAAWQRMADALSALAPCRSVTAVKSRVKWAVDASRVSA